MSEVIVTSESNTVVSSNTALQSVVTDSQTTQVIVTGLMGPPGASTFADLKDIDLSALGPGSLLVYNTIAQKWIATNLLEQQVFEGGQF